MGVTNNSVNDMLKIQSSAAGKGKKAKGPELASDENTFRRLMEESQSLNKEGSRPGKDASSASDKAAQETVSADGQNSSDEIDVNKQMLIAAMMAGQMPSIVRMDAQEEVPAQADAANLEGVQQILLAQTSGNEVQQMPEASLEAEGLGDENKAFAQAANEQTVLQAEQPAASKEDVLEIVKSEVQVKTVSAENDTQKLEKEPEQNPNAETALFQTVDAAPIRVGDSSLADKKVEVPVAEQLENQISGAIKAKVSSLELELNPKSLGRIHVEMEWMQDGSLHVSIKAEKAVAQTLLENSAGELQRMLEQDAQQMVRLEIQQAAKDELPNHAQDGRHQGQQNQERQNRDDDSESGNRFMQELRLGLAAIGG